MPPGALLGKSLYIIAPSSHKKIMLMFLLRFIVPHLFKEYSEKLHQKFFWLIAPIHKNLDYNLSCNTICISSFSRFRFILFAGRQNDRHGFRARSLFSKVSLFIFSLFFQADKMIEMGFELISNIPKFPKSKQFLNFLFSHGLLCKTWIVPLLCRY